MNLLTTTIIAAIATTAAPTLAEAGPRDRLDRIEDRIDRRENVIDRQTNNGPLDRIEDVADRIEDRRDRQGFDGPSRFDRHERRSWRRLWGNSEG
ncbi:MAG: hypothetical protein HKN27_07325 [Silicimonas sp.]|nr:hypothetical protein [Silicimonas sp.]